MKLFRDVLRVLMMHTQTFDFDSFKEQDTSHKLSFVDRMMMIRLFEFSKQVTEAYDKFDLKQVYELTQRFVVEDVTNFLFEFSKYRRRRFLTKL